MTGREMCEYIAKWAKEKHGKNVDPMAIWNASPTGELCHVFDLYWAARAAMGDPMPLPCNGCGSMVIGEHHVTGCTGSGARIEGGG